MTTIIIVSKEGLLQEREIDTNQSLFKVAGFRNDNGFLVLDIFKIKLKNIDYRIYLYGKTKGKRVDSNKYVFYPSSEKKIAGNCLLVHHSLDNSFLPFTINEWNHIKEEIFHTVIQEKGLDVKKTIKKNSKKKDVKKSMVTMNETEEQNKLKNNTPYLDCSKELTFEKFV